MTPRKADRNYSKSPSTGSIQESGTAFTRADNDKEAAAVLNDNQVEVREAPLIAHIVLSLDVGGLENGLVNLINHMPDRYRHVIICLSHYAEFRERIDRPDVDIIALNKQPGKDLPLYFRLWRTLHRLRPDIAHTRDFATLDSLPVIAFAGVRHRVHSLHGWQMKDTRKYLLLHRSLKYLIHHNVTVSQDLAAFLKERIRVPDKRVQAICNGVDTGIFHPPAGNTPGLEAEAGPEFGPDKFIVGTAGRLVAVKDQLTLIRAFAQLVRKSPALADRLRLVIIGDGPLKSDLHTALEQENLLPKCWLAGSRNDVAAILRGMHLFVLPSISEGISNTILEAMASGLPVIATNVGGNPELVADGETGRLVSVSDATALAGAIESYAVAPEMAAAAGRTGRERSETEFSMNAMANTYARVYDKLLEH
jgi:sugar transferase (PEP-CTERM/EpsH1 system associated)